MRDSNFFEISLKPKLIKHNMVSKHTKYMPVSIINSLFRLLSVRSYLLP